MSEMHNISKIKLSKLPLQSLLLWVEGLWLAAMIFAFWHRDDPFRYTWDFLIVLSIPIYLMRWLIHKRLWTRSPFDPFFIAFILLSLYNFTSAPISRADYFVIICRPLSGIFLVYYFMEHARQHGHIRYLLAMSVVLGILIGFIALVSTQWESGKGDAFAFITANLPILNHRQVMPDMQLSFNPNEIGGALSYLCPLLLGLFFSLYHDYIDKQSRKDQVISYFVSRGALVGFVLTFSALMLGQSRFAIAGVFIALLIVILFTIPKWRYRLPVLSIWGFVLVLEILIVTNVLPLQDNASIQDKGTNNSESASGLTDRDERTLSTRFEIWERALWMVRDYPLTGAGMSTYRAMVMRDAYTIPYYKNQTFGPPHAHNELLQIGADLGIGGYIIYIGWYAVIFYMMISIFQRKIILFNTMTIAITGGILAHMGYAVGDAITLWDRFAFLHWWFFALVAALYTLVIHHTAKPSHKVAD